jgi:hypothetical protein
MANKYRLEDNKGNVVIRSHYRLNLVRAAEDATSGNPRIRSRMETSEVPGLRRPRKLTLIQLDAEGKETKLATFGE